MRLNYLIPVIIAAVISILLYKILKLEKPVISESIQENIEIEKFSLPILGEKAKIISDSIFDSKKLIIVNFFSSWCSECAKEHKFLVQLAKDNDIKIYGIISKDYDSNVIDFIKALGNPYDIVANDMHGRLAIYFGVRSIPTSILIKSKKIIKIVHKSLDQDLYIKYINPYL